MSASHFTDRPNWTANVMTFSKKMSAYTNFAL